MKLVTFSIAVFAILGILALTKTFFFLGGVLLYVALATFVVAFIGAGSK